MAALQREHELAPLHRLEADGARVVERLRERLPVAKLREPVRGGALLARDRHGDRVTGMVIGLRSGSGVGVRLGRAIGRVW